MMPLRDSQTFINLMTKFSNPVLGILAGALFTAVIQSSSASVGILQALAGSGVIGLSQAVYVLFGQNIGTCITAVLASIGTARNAKRTTIIHLLFNIIGTIIFTIVCILTPFAAFVESLTPDNVAAQIANMHTIFNITTTILLLPFGTYLAKITTKILPDLPEEKRLEYAKAVTDASRRLANLITNILKLNKLENQQIYPAVQTYDLGEQLCACLLDLEGAWEQKELEIENDIEEGVMVDMDAELLTLVWNNLFSNAVKFTEAHGRIALSLKSEGDHAIVSVSDTGCGISPEIGSHIFEKFYQGDTSRAVQGNGLGLALVKRVMDIVGGDISVSSQVGKGSTFTVKIRRKKDGTG